MFGPMTPERRMAWIRLAAFVGAAVAGLAIVAVASQFESPTKEVFVQE